MVTMATYTQLHHFELDLSAACYPNSISGRFNDVVPVLKTSTGKGHSYSFSSPIPHWSNFFSAVACSHAIRVLALQHVETTLHGNPRSRRHHGLPKSDHAAP